ncbi:hypothetical protein DSL72_003377 [Monilinia vaccinii-corymbosi]|uniref:Uncharacterized protein n=1 Tax=Monilinia vaccinii-corymbosi TaxID=61207 RepID=A0A8A3NWP5_9HELO|nr:hypothetical protein DSL72_003377 [Monilinia vaccinii-corymbosi]
MFSRLLSKLDRIVNPGRAEGSNSSGGTKKDTPPPRNIEARIQMTRLKLDRRLSGRIGERQQLLQQLKARENIYPSLRTTEGLNQGFLPRELDAEELEHEIELCRILREYWYEFDPYKQTPHSYSQGYEHYSKRALEEKRLAVRQTTQETQRSNEKEVENGELPSYPLPQNSSSTSRGHYIENEAEDDRPPPSYALSEKSASTSPCHQIANLIDQIKVEIQLLKQHLNEEYLNERCDDTKLQ